MSGTREKFDAQACGAINLGCGMPKQDSRAQALASRSGHPSPSTAF
jgi:hypothetical protein